MTDPSKYGAKLANPAKYGAKPVKQPEKKRGYFSRVKESFHAGKDKIKQSFADAEKIKNPGQLFRRSLKLGSGIVESASAPLTAAAEPVIRPTIGRLINKVGEEIGESEAVQRFANSKAGRATEEIAGGVQDFTTIATVVTGPKALKTGAAKVGGQATDAIATATAGVPAKLERSLVESYRKILNPTARQASIEARFAKNTPEFLAKERIRLRVKDGKLDPTDAINQLENLAQTENPLFESLLRSEGRYIDLDQVAQAAKLGLRHKGTDLSKAKRHIDNEIAAYKTQFKQHGIAEGNSVQVPLDKLNEIKKDLWSKTKGFGTPDADLINDTNYILGRAFQRTIETSVDDISIRAINKRLGDISSSIRLLEKRTNMPVQGGRLNRYFSRLTGAVAGSAGGPFGVLGGAITAERLAGVLQDAQLPAQLKLYLIEHLRGTKKGASIVADMERLLRQRAEDVMNRTALPPPSTIIVPPTSTPNINPMDPTLGGRL